MRKTPLILTVDLYNTKSLVLNLSVLAAWLEDLDHNFSFTKIIIEGGEPSVLSSFYLDLLIKLCETYTKEVTITTNLKCLNRELINSNVNLQVHLPLNQIFNDFKIIKQNIQALAPNKVLTAISYITDCWGLDSQEVVSRLNNLPLKSWEIKNNFDSSTYTIEKVEQVLEEYLHLTNTMKFAFINNYLINHIRPINNYFNTVYASILPHGVLVHNIYTEVGLQKRFYTDVVDFKHELEIESKAVTEYCKDCPFQEYCMAESINPYYEGLSCSGFRNLLKNNT